MKSIENKVVLITGASFCIGKAIAQYFAEKKAIIICIGNNMAALQQIANKIVAMSGRVYVFRTNLGDHQAIAEVVDQIQRQIGSVDILINYAGNRVFKPMHEASLSEVMQPVMEPFGSAIALTHALLPGMIRRRNGHIVNITSPAGYLPLPGLASYSAARHAINGLTHALREELNPFHIGVSLICPPRVKKTGRDAVKSVDNDPLVARFIPEVHPVDVAVQVERAILDNRQEVIFPGLMWVYSRIHRQLPQLTFKFLKRLGLLHRGHA